MNTYIYIMAGGQGSRFAPVSTPDKPKQFLKIVNQDSLLRQTYNRIKQLEADIYIGTHINYMWLVNREVPEVSYDNIVAETESKNTAPAIALMAHIALTKSPDAVIICLPSDHYIVDEEKFRKVLNKAVKVAHDHSLVVTLGMRPEYASTEYGYIKVDRELSEGVYIVRKFIEKPHKEVAEMFYSSKGFYWNSGIFVWRADVIMQDIEKYAPEIYKSLKKLPKVFDFEKTYDINILVDYFKEVPKISIDYAVMEHLTKIVTIPCDVGWTDLGTWDSLERFIQKGHKNVEISGDFIKYLNSREVR